MSGHNPTERFSDKVRNYVKYRPGYPIEIIDYLRSGARLPDNAIIVDVGSGTGIFSKLLIDAGYNVFAVEPNEAMRVAAEESLGYHKNFVSIAGSGEQTTLPASAADMIVCATAFHWFDREKAKAEFIRVLKPSGKVALIWNIRSTDADGFSVAYKKFWRKYDRGDKPEINELVLKEFFQFEVRTFEHYQEFDLDGLIGRSFSSSLSPKEETEEGAAFRNSLKELFDQHQRNGKIRIHYTAKVYLGKVN